MTRDEALVLLTLAYGHHPALADFNIAAVNRVLDLLIQAEREACAKAVLAIANDDAGNPYKQALRIGAEAIRRRSEIDSIVQNERSVRSQNDGH